MNPYLKDGQAVHVPVHGSRDLGAGLVAAIQRQTGVKLKYSVFNIEELQVELYNFVKQFTHRMV